MTRAASRLLPGLLLVLGVAGCGAIEHRPEPPRKFEPTLAAADAGAQIVAAAVTPAAEPATYSSPASAAYAPGLRSGDPRLQLNLHVFGFSYHPDRTGARARHLDNELNLGLGLKRELHHDRLGVTSLEAGFFKDSGSNWAKFGGVGYQFKLGDHWRLGANLLAMHSTTYNKGRGFVAPIPQLSYDFGAVSLNAIYVPRVRELSQFAAFGFYVTTPLGTW